MATIVNQTRTIESEWKKIYIFTAPTKYNQIYLSLAIIALYHSRIGCHKVLYAVFYFSSNFCASCLFANELANELVGVLYVHTYIYIDHCRGKITRIHSKLQLNRLALLIS